MKRKDRARKFDAADRYLKQTNVFSVTECKSRRQRILLRINKKPPSVSGAVD
jgi:hypothetical protein